MKGLKFISTARYVPPHEVTNYDMEKIVDTSHDWIVSRTGIEKRYFAKDESTTDLAIKSGRIALEKANIDRNDIEFVIVATFTPENYTPSTASMVQGALGLKKEVLAFDLNAACSGFLYGMKVMEALLQSKPGSYGLLIGSESISKILDFSDRTTCVLFGDGAGAAVFGLDEGESYHVYAGIANDEDLVCRALPAEGEDKFLRMQGKAVFRFAADAIPSALHALEEASGIPLEDVDYFVCHQANKRIISHVQRSMKLPEEKFFMNLQEYGNTSAASVIIALDEMNEKGMLKEDMKIALVGFGGGLTWGASLINW